MSKIILWFVKITGYLPHLFFFRKKIHYVNKQVQSRKIKNHAIIVSNHLSIWDVALYMFVFVRRNIHILVGEVMYQKNKLFTWFLKKIGGIKVDRDTYNFNFLNEAINVLDKGGVIEIYPEARLPRDNEKDMLEFKPSFVYIALESGAPIIPVCTNGSYGKRKRTHVLIGEPINLRELYNDDLTEKENIDFLTKFVYDYIYDLRKMLDEKTK